MTAASDLAHATPGPVEVVRRLFEALNERDLDALYDHCWAEDVVAYYPFEGNVSDEAEQFGSNSGIANNELSAIDNVPQFVDGQVGSAIALNSDETSPSRLTAELHSDLDLSGTFTIESWIYPNQLDGWSRLVMQWDGSGKNSILWFD